MVSRAAVTRLTRCRTRVPAAALRLSAIQHRSLSDSSALAYAQSYMQVGPQIGHQNQMDQSDPSNDDGKHDKEPKQQKSAGGSTWMPGIESALATGAGARNAQLWAQFCQLNTV